MKLEPGGYVASGSCPWHMTTINIDVTTTPYFGSGVGSSLSLSGERINTSSRLTMSTNFGLLLLSAFQQFNMIWWIVLGQPWNNGKIEWNCL